MTRREYYAAVQQYKDNHLEHHGVIGQKWGIRRYQNPDGSLTAEGKEHYKETALIRSKKDVDDIINNMNEKDKRYILENNSEYFPKEYLNYIEKRFLKRCGDIPIAFFDLIKDGDNLNIAIGVRSDYQGKGYGKKITKEALQYINDHIDDYKKRNINKIVWGVAAGNQRSSNLAKKNGFVEDYQAPDGSYVRYKKNVKD